MPSNYRHYFGDEAINKLMVNFGLAGPQKQKLPNYRECPNIICKEFNIPDAPFCVKCRVPLTVPGFMEQNKQKDLEMHELKQQMAQSKQEIKDQFQAYEDKIHEFVHDIQSSLNQEEKSRPSLTPGSLNFMLKKMREILDHKAPGWYDQIFGPGASAHRLTPKTQKKIEELLKEVTPLIEADNRQRDLALQKRREILVKTLDSKAS
jgi:small-conductance mechanosensitive channel